MRYKSYAEISRRPPVAGVYALVNNGIIKYIGASENIHMRTRYHEKMMPGDEIEILLLESDFKKRESAEISFIKLHEPERNKMHTSRYKAIQSIGFSDKIHKYKLAPGPRTKIPEILCDMGLNHSEVERKCKPLSHGTVSRICRGYTDITMQTFYYFCECSGIDPRDALEGICVQRTES